MAKIFVLYRVTNKKNPNVKYGITSYDSSFIQKPLLGSVLEGYLLHKIKMDKARTSEYDKNISRSSSLFCCEWLYQNIEKSECEHYLELVYNVPRKMIGSVVQNPNCQ